MQKPGTKYVTNKNDVTGAKHCYNSQKKTHQSNQKQLLCFTATK